MTTAENKIDGSIIGELALGELPHWSVGVCDIEVQGGVVIVSGENGHPVGEVALEDYKDKESPLTGELVIDTGAVAEEVNELIAEEHDSL